MQWNPVFFFVYVLLIDVAMLLGVCFARALCVSVYI